MKKLHCLIACFLIPLLLSCSGSTGPSDNIPPDIITVIPADNAIDIPLDASIIVVFTEPIDSTTIGGSSFSVSPAIAGDFQFNGDTVIFAPISDFENGTEYTVTVTTAIEDPAGNSLVSGYSWTFTTIEDPNSAPPVVTSRTPGSGAYNIEINTAISATFSKGIDPATLTASSFTVSNGVTGTIVYNSGTRIVTLTPDSDLDYSTSYIVTLTTAVTDTFGISLAAEVVWSFSTRPDPSIPLVVIVTPLDSSVVDDEVNITVNATQQDGIDKVELYVGGILVDSVLNQSGNVVFTWDASAWIIGSVHSIYAKAYADGNEATSQVVNLIHLWEEVAFDNNDSWATDLKRVYARTTSVLLELRYEFWENWTFPYPYDSLNDTTYFDLSFDLAIFFDTDRNRYSGKSVIGLGQLNDIGAEYRAIIGLHGGDTALARPHLTCDTCWIKVYDTTGFARHVVPRDTNIFELAIPWTDFSSPAPLGVYILNINVMFEPGNSDPVEDDWLPNKGAGHIEILRRNQYVGKPNPAFKPAVVSNNRRGLPRSLPVNNPFN